MRTQTINVADTTYGETTAQCQSGERAIYFSFEESAGVYAEGTEFAIGRISMVANTGTYLDTPGHRHREREGHHGEEGQRHPRAEAVGEVEHLLALLGGLVVPGATEVAVAGHTASTPW